MFSGSHGDKSTTFFLVEDIELYVSKVVLL